MQTDVRSVLDTMIANARVGYADISRLIGRNPAYIQQFIKRGTPRKLQEEDRRILASYFDVSEETLGGPSPHHNNSEQLRSAFPVVAIPRVTMRALAGAGAVEEDRRTLGAINFDPGWLRNFGVNAQRVSIIRVAGESMQPTLHDGDEIMIDHDDDISRLRDGVYVLRLDGALMVKRIVSGPGRGRFGVFSDNPHYPNWVFVDPALVRIVGRVVWTCHRIG